MQLSDHFHSESLYFVTVFFVQSVVKFCRRQENKSSARLRCWNKCTMSWKPPAKLDCRFVNWWHSLAFSTMMPELWWEIFVARVLLCLRCMTRASPKFGGLCLCIKIIISCHWLTRLMALVMMTSYLRRNCEEHFSKLSAHTWDRMLGVSTYLCLYSLYELLSSHSFSSLLLSQCLFA